MDQTGYKRMLIFFCYICLGLICLKGYSNPSASGTEVTLDNPMSVEYLQSKLLKTQPRLIINKAAEEQLKEKLKTDATIQNLYKAIQLNSETIMSEPLLERKQIGMR